MRDLRKKNQKYNLRRKLGKIVGDVWFVRFEKTIERIVRDLRKEIWKKVKNNEIWEKYEFEKINQKFLKNNGMFAKFPRFKKNERNEKKIRFEKIMELRKLMGDVRKLMGDVWIWRKIIDVRIMRDARDLRKMTSFEKNNKILSNLSLFFLKFHMKLARQ